MNRKTKKNSCESVYCDIWFIAVVCNQTQGMPTAEQSSCLRLRFTEAHPETKTLVCNDGRFSGENYKEMGQPGQQKAGSKDVGPAVAHPSLIP